MESAWPFFHIWNTTIVIWAMCDYGDDVYKIDLFYHDNFRQ